MEKQTENRPMDMAGGEEGGGEIYGESNMEICNTICKIDSQRKFAVWLRELKQGFCDRLMGGWGGRWDGGPGGEGTWVYLWLIFVDIWQKTTKFCKALILQLKNKKKKEKQNSGAFRVPMNPEFTATHSLMKMHWCSHAQKDRLS